MPRRIYEVYAKIVDANGAYNTLSGYPKVFDSKLYDNNIEKALARAKGEYYNALGAMYPRDDRMVQIAILFGTYEGIIDITTIGSMEETEIEE